MTEADRLRSIARLFEAARERDTAEREQMFDALSREWNETIAEVRRLLAAHDRAAGPLDAPVGDTRPIDGG